MLNTVDDEPWWPFGCISEEEKSIWQNTLWKDIFMQPSGLFMVCWQNALWKDIFMQPSGLFMVCCTRKFLISIMNCLPCICWWSDHSVLIREGKCAIPGLEGIHLEFLGLLGCAYQACERENIPADEVRSCLFAKVVSRYFQGHPRAGDK